MKSLTPLERLDSFFDGIRRISDEGNEYFLPEDLSFILGDIWDTDLKTKPRLTKEDYVYLLLDCAAKIALERRSGASCDASFLLNQARTIYEGNSLDFIFHAVYTLIHNALQFEIDECFMYLVIEKHFPSLFFNAQLLKRKEYIDAKNIPDYLIEIGKCVIPVEVKRGAFGKSALQQLLRYVKKYSSDGKTGYAVAHNLDKKVILPDGITFVCLDVERMRMLEKFNPINLVVMERSVMIFRNRLYSFLAGDESD
jgi:hypothetical protein